MKQLYNSDYTIMQKLQYMVLKFVLDYQHENTKEM